MTHNTKKKGFTLVEIMIVVVIIGLLAAMAIPAFNKVRQESREKTILNNLRQVASAGQQYILDEGVTDVDFDQLEGTYFPTIDPVAGESYDNLVVVEGGGSLTISINATDSVFFTY